MDHNPAGLMQRDLFGLSVDAVTMSQAVARCTDAIKNGEHLSIGVLNAAKVVAMRRNPQLRQAVGECDLILADGQAVVWASPVVGSPLPERVYFLGARPDILARMLDEVGRRFPGLPVAGARDGYYQVGEEAEVAEDIRRSGADILFVGMSSPRKEVFLSEWGTSTEANVIHGVGGSCDVLAGLTRRAPVWWQDHGLEWLYRALQEPVRLGRRYLTTNMSFIMLVARERMHGRVPGGNS